MGKGGDIGLTPWSAGKFDSCTQIRNADLSPNSYTIFAFSLAPCQHPLEDSGGHDLGHLLCLPLCRSSVHWLVLAFSCLLLAQRSGFICKEPLLWVLRECVCTHVGAERQTHGSNILSKSGELIRGPL